MCYSNSTHGCVMEGENILHILQFAQNRFSSRTLGFGEIAGLSIAFATELPEG